MRALLPLLALVFLLGGCAPANEVPTAGIGGSCSLALADAASDDAQITAVLRAESELVVAQEIDALMALWAADGEVVDAGNTPADPSDDQHWMDTDAVRHRYVRIVFPGNPQASTPTELAITVTPEDASTARAVVTATTRIGNEVSPGGDRWDLRKQAGCWLIERLSYNLEAP